MMDAGKLKKTLAGISLAGLIAGAVGGCSAINNTKAGDTNQANQNNRVENNEVAYGASSCSP